MFTNINRMFDFFDMGSFDLSVMPTKGLLSQVNNYFKKYDFPNLEKDLSIFDYKHSNSIYEDSDKNVVLEYQIPGVEKEDISVTVSKNNYIDIIKIVIKKLKRNEKQKTIIVDEEFKVNDKYDVETISCEYKNGVLKIIVKRKKIDEQKDIISKKIDIK